jgi:hypothetical protein
VAKKTSNPIPPILHTISGWWYPTHLKNIKVSWDDEIPNIWKNKKCSKPPTRTSMGILIKVYNLLITKQLGIRTGYNWNS